MAKYSIGIDLGGTFIKFCLLDEARRARGVFQLPTPADGGPDAVIEHMIGGGRKLLRDNKVARSDIIGVGIGSPGPLDLKDGIVLEMPNIAGFKNVSLRDRVGGGLELPAALENDANAAAFGEYICGAGAGAGDMVLLTLGTGIGSGIIVDGKVFHGYHGIGAELGHMIIVPEGEPCGCGQKGCLERYASATFISQAATHRLRSENCRSVLQDVLKRKGAIDAKDIQDAAGAGDAFAAEVWNRVAYYLALACVNICRIFDPDEIVLAGGMAKAGDDLVSPLHAHFKNLNWTLTAPTAKIVLARLGNDAGVIGAAGVAWQEFGES
ncbi:MAG: ROK family glucokinase [Planctomycetota bacterium]|nr:ROK family glucokinase [Planctomycetota bacterium]